MRQLSIQRPNERPIIIDCATPTPGHGEALIDIRAAALNHRDCWIHQGMYPGVEYPCYPGSDAAGIVSACGDGVDASWLGRGVIINPGFNWGDDERVQDAAFTILGIPRAGTHATHVCVPVSQLHDKPEELRWEEAAALPLAGLTAFRACFSQGALQTGETVLVNGIGGGVALFALQFALGRGATVVVTSANAEKRERALAMGASAAYDYTDPEWSQAMRATYGGFDLAIDGAAGDTLNHLIHAARPAARIVLYGGTAGLPSELNIRPLFWKQLTLIGSTMGSPADFSRMLDFVSSRNLMPVIDSVYPLDQADEAYARMEAGDQFGKIVLTP